MRQILTRDMLAQHQSYLSEWDVIWDPLYDFNAYAAAGQTSLSFFAQPQGQGVTSAPGATGTKTDADTNMDSANQLGKGNRFYVTGVEMQFFPGINPARAAALEAAFGFFLNDIWTVSKSGVVVFAVGSNREYIHQGPIGLFPPSTRLAVGAALTGAGATADTFGQIDYATFSGEVYTIIPVLLDDNQVWTYKVNWPAAVALPSNTIARIGARLRGYRIRNAQ